MKTINFSDSMSPSEVNDFVLHHQNQHDIACIGQFISAPMVIKSIDDVATLNPLVETRNRINIIINAIKNYENQN